MNHQALPHQYIKHKHEAIASGHAPMSLENWAKDSYQAYCQECERQEVPPMAFSRWCEYLEPEHDAEDPDQETHCNIDYCFS